MDGTVLASIKHERTVVTYGWLWHASKSMLEAGKANQKGSAWQFLSSCMLTAFTVEAFTNHVGQDLIVGWKKVERTTSPAEKLRLLAEQVGVDLGEDDARPMTTIHGLVRFRNSLAHGRTQALRPDEEIVKVTEVDRHLREGRPLTDWEDKIRSADFATIAREDVEEILRRIHEAMPSDNKDRLFDKGMHLSTASYVGPA